MTTGIKRWLFLTNFRTVHKIALDNNTLRMKINLNYIERFISYHKADSVTIIQPVGKCRIRK
jgi:hypothetical protein